MKSNYKQDIPPKDDTISEQRVMSNSMDEEQQKQKPVLDLDYIYQNYVGTLGFWQVMIVVLACLSTPSSTMFPLFLNSIPKVRCNMGSVLEEEFIQRNYTFDQILSLISDDAIGCIMKNITKISDIDNNSTKLENIKCPSGYKYENYPHLYPGSIAKEWDLVCDYENLLPMGTNMYMIGTLVGLLLSGSLGDRFGRKRTAFFMGITELISGFLIAASPHYIMFTLFRSIVAGCSIGKMMVLLLVSVETTNSRYRSVLVATWSVLQFWLSRSLLSLEAYFVHNWRYLIIIHNMPAALVLLFIPLIPESPRWFLARNKAHKAIEVINKGKWFNSIFGLPKSPISEAEMKEVVRQYQLDITVKSSMTATPKKPKGKLSPIYLFIKSFVDIFKTKKLAVISTFSTLVYGGETFVYYGLMFAGRKLKENIYLTVFFNALMCLPATLIVATVYKVFVSRKRPLVFNYTISLIALIIGSAYTLALQPSNDVVLNACINVGLVFLQASLNMLYIYIAELFPSDIRSRGSCYTSGLGRLLGSFCVYLNQLDGIVHGLPFACYCGFLVLQLLFLIILPDTDGNNLKDKV